MTENTTTTQDLNNDTLTPAERAGLAYLRTLPADVQQAVGDILAAEDLDAKTAIAEAWDADTRRTISTLLNLLNYGDELTPEQRAAADLKAQRETIRTAWKALPLTDRLLDASNTSGAVFIDKLTLFIMSELLMNDFTGRLMLQMDGLDNTFAILRDSIEAGLTRIRAVAGEDLQTWLDTGELYDFR